MRRIIKYACIIVIISVIVYIGFALFMSVLLSYSPKRIKALPEEKILFENLKTKYGFEKISRTPEREDKLLFPKDTMTYDLSIDYVDCNKSRKYYDSIAYEISNMIKRNIQLDKKFYKYTINFSCKEITYKDKDTIVFFTYSYLR